MINVENLTKSFSGNTLFREASFTINPRERVGLVGRNGTGKTTLFRLIANKEDADEGTITMPKHYRIGYVLQNLEFREDTVLKEGCRGLPEDERGHFWKVEKILAGLGFSEEDMHLHPEELSGGHQVRLNLVKVLVSEPDLLLLDEPTNYLDITSIRWIERFLVNWPHELMVITHDRSFMDTVVTHILGIHRRKIRKMPGNTGKFYSQIAQDEEVYEKSRIKDERRRKEMEAYITRFRAKARLASLVQSRIKALQKQEKRGRLEAIETLDFWFQSKPYRGKYVMSARNISFSYDPALPLIKDFSITLGRRDRVCVVGKNGKGKTTLLKLLSGTLEPQNGETVYNVGVEMGFFEQTNIRSLVDTRTIEEEILSAHPEVDRQRARNICGTMMFEGDDALKKIEVISGGEKARVMLGKLLVTPVNLLLLDEPSNHLDMESCDALLAAVDNFEGAVVMVTHNEMFLHALAQRLIVFQSDRPYIYEGTYQHFLEGGGWEDEDTPVRAVRQVPDGEEPRGRLTKKEVRRRRSEIISLRSKALRPIEQRIAQVEKEIETHERTINQANSDLEEASKTQNGPRIVELSQAIHDSQSSIDRLFDELEKLTRTLEDQGAMYEEKLQELEEEVRERS
jgi:ATP-binding cassette subfamily F protein 3